MNTLGGSGLWCEDEGFYYDHMTVGDDAIPLRLRSLVGVIPLLAVEVLEQEKLDRLPNFSKRMRWFLDHRKDLARHIGYLESNDGAHGHRLLSIPSRERLVRVLRYVLDERELLSPYGVRSLSRVYEAEPYALLLDGTEYRVNYAPAEGDTTLFGGNSNWRGPVWFPINFLIIASLQQVHHYYGEDFIVECPTGSGHWVRLHEAAQELRRRLARIFLPDEDGKRPCHGAESMFHDDPHAQDLVLFHEYFHGEDGHGLGASHQTGWTALITRTLEVLAGERGLD